MNEIKGLSNIRLIFNQGNKGALGNFSYLVKNAKMYKYNYIMFCDQDDVWYEKKIELTLQEMISKEKEVGVETPILVFSERELVDSQLKVLNGRQIELQTGLLSVLAQNPIYGCTMMINKALLNKAGNMPFYVQMHDYYYVLVAATYGVITRIPVKLMKYRLHQDNVTGGINNYSLLKKLDLWTKVNVAINQMLEQNYYFCKYNMVNVISVAFLQMLQLKGFARLFKAYRIGYKKVGFFQTIRLYYVLFKFTVPPDGEGYR